MKCTFGEWEHDEKVRLTRDDSSNLSLKSKLHFTFSSCVLHAYWLRTIVRPMRECAHVRTHAVPNYARVRIRVRDTHDRTYVFDTLDRAYFVRAGSCAHVRACERI